MKSMSCSLGRSSFGTLLVILLSFLVLSLPVQSCRLNQNILVQAASMNQRGQSETKRLSLSDQENADKSLSNLSNQQSTIQNLSSTSTGDPKFEKSEVIRKTAKLQMPFVVNEGQTDEKVAFYANTFGGTVFVTKDGNIVYSLPHTVAHASPLVHYDIDKNETGHTGLPRYRGKEGQCIVHRALCTMYPYCTWNFPVYYSETNSPLKRGTHPLIPSREGNGVCNATPTTRRDTERRVTTTTVALKEQFVGANVKAIQGEQPSVTKVNYFKGNDPSKWKTNVSTYDYVNLGEIYKGIDLKLKAYGDNVEKLFYVKPGADPEQIKIRLSGAKDCGVQNAECGIENPKSEFRNPKLWVNEHGELVAETELGPVKFTKPVAYQETNGRRVDVSVEYRVESSEAENKSSKHKTCNSKRMSTNPKSAIQNVEAEVSNPKSKIANRKLEYGFKVASYDKTKDLIIDPMLASTYLGGSGSGGDYGKSLTLDTSGNVYVTGFTKSTDFPTTSGAYDTSSNGGSRDVFISKLDSGLTSLLASTYLGGTSSDEGRSLTLDTSGNVYVTGYTESKDFPTTSGAYDASKDGYSDVFVSKLNGGLTSLLASTYLGGSSEDGGFSLTLNTSGNVYVTGNTYSTDFPTTSGAYDTSFNGGSYGDVFVSKLDSNLSASAATTPTPSPTPTPTPTPSPSPTPSPRVTPSSTPTTCTDSYEPNDSSTQAYGYLTSGSSYSGKICSSSDVDWFKVNITTSGTISINLTVPSSNDYYVELYGPSYSWVAGNHDVSISYNATTTGNYYIRVLGSNGSYSATNSYTLTYTFTSTTSATPTPSPTPTPTTTPEKEDLLKKYAPILYMHPDERYHPTNAQTMLDNSELWKKGKLKGKLVNKNKKNALKLKHLKIYNEEKYYLKLKDTSNEKLKKKNYWKINQTIYGRLFTETDTKKTILQYWFFYVYNDWGGLKEGGNKHEGDWEMIQIILGSDNQPSLITYSFHHGGQTFEWDEDEVSKDKSGNHPFVYVTHGGHGCWNKPGNNAWYQAPNICLDCTDETEEGGDILYPDSMSSSEIQSSSSKYSYTLEDMSNSEQGSEYYWINWKGYWGNQKRMKGIVDLGSSGPSSPPYIDYIDDDGIDGRWKKPILWAVSPNPSDYEICASSNIKVIAHDMKGNIVNLLDNCSIDSLCGGCSTIKILYSEKDLVFDVYSLDGKEVDLKISRYKKTGEVCEVEFYWLEIPKNGKATLRFSPDENPDFEMEIYHDHNGIFDYRVSPDYATQNP